MRIYSHWSIGGLMLWINIKRLKAVIHGSIPGISRKTVAEQLENWNYRIGYC